MAGDGTMPARARMAAGLGERGGIGDGGAGGDDRGVVAGDVGHQQRDDAGRVSGGGEAAALDGGQVLADAIHVADARAAAEQVAVDGLLVGERKAFRG